MSGSDAAILVLNAGSSSIKFCVFLRRPGGPVRGLSGQVSGLGTSPRLVARRDGVTVVQHEWPDRPALSHAEALEELLGLLQAQLQGASLVAVGHRVVHGGLEFMAPKQVDRQTLARLERYVPLAPLHQPHNLAAIRLLLERLPGVPQIACFDTAFHRTIPEVAQLFALPPRFAEAGVRRYGFHGLSYEYIASALATIDPVAARGRTIVLHLGNGASMCAMREGRSVATTMGFTAVEGLPMGTRSGSLDPGVLLFLMDEMKLGPREIERLIYKESGLLGVSGISSDMRELLQLDAAAARLAVELFVYRACREAGSLAAALGGLDAVVFTAGIGENQPQVRERICTGSAWLGVELDRTANATHGPRISTVGSKVAAWVVPTDEESMIARHVVNVLQGAI